MSLFAPDASLNWLDRPKFFHHPWTPPEDPDTPCLPYTAGFTVPIHRHVPPALFGHVYGPGPRSNPSREYLFKTTQSEQVVTNPPLDSDVLPQMASEMARLTVTTPIMTGTADGAQVVACTVMPQNASASESKPFRAVAKIYDALYYRLRADIGNKPRDVVSESDEDYSREAAAYEFLQKAGQTGPTGSAPADYGSWTFTLPITHGGELLQRPVRMVLMEHLDGTSLQGALRRNEPRAGKDAFHYPEEYRLEILARALDGYERQYHIGVDQFSFAARNVMIVPNADPNAERISGLPLPRTVIIDYNNAVVHPLIGSSKLPDSPHPCNPMRGFWDSDLCLDFDGWVPHRWWCSRRPMQEWLLKRFGTEEKKGLYAPIDVELHLDENDGADCPTTAKYGNYQPPLSMLKDGFRIPSFNPRDPRPTGPCKAGQNLSGNHGPENVE
ncbi:hypothetical protein F5883DRAFT_498277 [Diaporthe sp. PMI_573]|nr:hypothetical protein F5883DRAFT_498277 [Diaporthaceae sp. PMI_573]